MPRADLLALLRSKWHEERLLALLVMVELHRRGDAPLRAAILHTYLAHARCVNNWDLVDLSAPRIVGPHVDPARPALLEKLARSPSLWERRIAMLATFHWIAAGDPRPALRIARMLRDDPHDLIHKAVGWGLREVGKRDRAREEAWLDRHCARMPRTMLRYAIERLPPARRAYWLARPRISAASPSARPGGG
jgi:3-methyladenine DNA glycosylase AlkD